MATTPRRRGVGRGIALAVAAGALLALLPGGSGHAQSREAKKAREPYALIFGTVWDGGARPVQGVPVKMRRADQKRARWHLVSDRRGEFAQRVPAGQAEYVVWAELPKRKGEKQPPPRPEVRVSIENDERVDISLHLKP